MVQAAVINVAINGYRLRVDLRCILMILYITLAAGLMTLASFLRRVVSALQEKRCSCKRSVLSELR